MNNNHHVLLLIIHILFLYCCQSRVLHTSEHLSSSSCTGIIKSSSILPVNLQALADKRRDSINETSLCQPSTEQCYKLMRLNLTINSNYGFHPTPLDERKKRDVLVDPINAYEGTLRTLISANMNIGDNLCWSASDNINSTDSVLKLNNPIDYKLTLTNAYAFYHLNEVYTTAVNIIWNTQASCDCPLGTNKCTSTSNFCKGEPCINSYTRSNTFSNCFFGSMAAEDCFSAWPRSYTQAIYYKYSNVKTISYDFNLNIESSTFGTSFNVFNGVTDGILTSVGTTKLSTDSLGSIPDLPSADFIKIGGHLYKIDNIQGDNSYEPTNLGWNKIIGTQFIYNKDKIKQYISYDHKYCEADVTKGARLITTYADIREDDLVTVESYLSYIGEVTILNDGTIFKVNLGKLNNPMEANIQVDLSNIIFRYEMAKISDAHCYGAIKNLNGQYAKLICWASGYTLTGSTKIDIKYNNETVNSFFPTCNQGGNCSFDAVLGTQIGDNFFSLCFFDTFLGYTCVDQKIHTDNLILPPVYFDHVIKPPIVPKTNLLLDFYIKNKVWIRILTILIPILIVALVLGLIFRRSIKSRYYKWKMSRDERNSRIENNVIYLNPNSSSVPETKRLNEDSMEDIDVSDK